MARRLVITENITLDGVVENDGTWFDPTEDSDRGRELAAVTAEHAAASDAFLVGRTTFEEMRGFRPQQRDDRTGGYRPSQPGRQVRGVHHTAGSGLGGHERSPWWQRPGRRDTCTNRRPGHDIVLTGSITLAGHLLRENLVDEIRLFDLPGRPGPRPTPLPARLDSVSTAATRTTRHPRRHAAALQPPALTIRLCRMGSGTGCAASSSRCLLRAWKDEA